MFRRIADHLFLNKRGEIPFIIFFTFLVTFFISRIIAYSVHFDKVPDFLFFIRTVYIQGYHIHHFNFGIIILIIAGFLSLVDERRSHARTIAVLYGVGLALVMDEFGLLVTLDANAYWGRRSYDAVMITSLVLLNIVYFKGFWRVMGGTLKRIFRGSQPKLPSIK